MTSNLTIAGIAGGVGTTVVATLLGATDNGRDLTGADVIVARNDYRCASALTKASIPSHAVVLLIREPGRALTYSDFAYLVPNNVITIDADPAIARADDAGLLDVPRRAHERFRNLVAAATTDRRRRLRAAILATRKDTP